MKHKKVVWHDRKRNVFGWPWTFTVYDQTADKLFINTGFVNSKEDEVRLYRITDLSLVRSLWQKLIGTGTIRVTSADKTMGTFLLENINDSVEVKEKLSALVEESRQKNRVYARESMDAGGPGFGPGPGPDGPGFGPGPGPDGDMFGQGYDPDGEPDDQDADTDVDADIDGADEGDNNE